MTVQCACLPPPPCTKQCPTGQKCEYENIVCVTTPCIPRQVCKVECPLVRCRPCDFGYEKTADGCQTCTCKPAPLCDLKCKSGYECKWRKPVCVRHPCDVVPMKQCVAKECGPFETFNGCASCVPEPSCAEPNPISRLCLAVCQPRCECSTGYIRDANGRCIKPRECANEGNCRDNEVFNGCLKPPGCRLTPTCDDPEPKPNTTTFCAAVCVPGCVCPSGYVQNSDGICIPRDQCPQN